MSDSGSLFGAGPRTDASPTSHRESSAQFLERVAGDYWQAVRDLLDDWLGHVPPPERRDLMGRLRRAEDHTFQAAFLELYLRESLIQSGFDVGFHPRCQVSVDGQTSSPTPRARRSTSRRGRRARPRTSERVSGESVTSTTRSTRSTARTSGSGSMSKQRTVDLSPPRVYGRSSNRGLARKPRPGLRDLPRGSADLPLGAGRLADQVPRPAQAPAARGSGTGLRPLAVYGGSHAEWVDDAGVLKDALPDKGNAFGTPEHGLVVAIGTSYFSSDDFGVTNVLYALSNGCSIARAASSSGSPGDLAGTSMLATVSGRTSTCPGS